MFLWTVVSTEPATQATPAGRPPNPPPPAEAPRASEALRARA
jgi:hypothetical protein